MLFPHYCRGKQGRERLKDLLKVTQYWKSNVRTMLAPGEMKARRTVLGSVGLSSSVYTVLGL